MMRSKEMRKIVLASTALAGGMLLASEADAFEVTLSGNVEAEIIGDSEGNIGASAGDKDFAFRTDTKLKVTALDETDSGLKYGGTLDFETDAGSAGIDEAFIFLSGGFGRLELGTDDGAADNMYVSGQSVSAGTGGIDGTNVGPIGNDIGDSGDANKITYFTPRVGGFQFGASYAPDSGDENGVISSSNSGSFEDVIELGINYVGSFGGSDLTIAAVTALGDAETAGAADLEGFAVGAKFGVAGFNIGAGFGHQENGDRDFFDVAVAYSFGGIGASVGFEAQEAAGVDSSALVLSANTSLAPGFALAGDVSFNSSDAAGGDGTTYVVRTKISF